MVPSGLKATAEGAGEGPAEHGGRIRERCMQQFKYRLPECSSSVVLPHCHHLIATLLAHKV